MVLSSAACLDDLDEREQQLMIDDDLAGEAEVIDSENLVHEGDGTNTSSARLFQNLAEAKKQGHEGKTLKDYTQCVTYFWLAAQNHLIAALTQRIWAKLTAFCVTKGFIPSPNSFDSGPIPAEAADWFALYIAHESIRPPTCFFLMCSLINDLFVLLDAMS
jgi:hypothetical protein